MKSTLFSVLSVTFFVTLKGVAAEFTANTPANVAECEPVQLSWVGGTGPFDCSLTSGTNPNGPALVTFQPTNASPITYTVAFAANTQLDFVCRDSTGLLAQTAPFTVLAGVSTACLTAGPSGSSAAAGTTAALTSCWILCSCDIWNYACGDEWEQTHNICICIHRDDIGEVFFEQCSFSCR